MQTHTHTHTILKTSEQKNKKLVYFQDEFELFSCVYTKSFRTEIVKKIDLLLLLSEEILGV